MILAAVLVACVVGGVGAEPAGFYVATNGADNNSGRLERPFVTLERARDAVRSLKRGAGLPEGGNEGAQAAVNIGATIEAIGAHECLFDQCELAQTDSCAITLRMQIGPGCNIYINNIIAFSMKYAINMDVARSCVFINNIVYLDQGRLFMYEQWPHYEKYISKNIYWRTDRQPFVFAGQEWNEWRQQRMTPSSYFRGTPMDAGLRIADPKFVDAAKRDFRLKPDSPALALGFKPIDLDEIGLTGDEAWRTLPARVRVLVPAYEGVVALEVTNAVTLQATRGWF